MFRAIVCAGGPVTSLSHGIILVYYLARGVTCSQHFPSRPDCACVGVNKATLLNVRVCVSVSGHPNYYFLDLVQRAGGVADPEWSKTIIRHSTEQYSTVVVGTVVIDSYYSSSYSVAWYTH